MIWLLNALGWAKTALSALAGLVRAYPLQAACIALLCLSGWLWMGKRDALEERDEARAELIAQAKAYKAAQVEAERKAMAERAINAQLTKELAHATNERAASLDDSTRRALADYRMRAKIPACPSSGTDQASLHRGASGDLGTSADDQLVAVTAADLEAFRNYAVRASVCQEWARGLIDAGLAVWE